MRKEFRVEPGSDGDFEVRERADVFVAAFPARREAAADAKRRNEGGK